MTYDDYTAPRFNPTRPTPRKLLFAGALLGGSAVACGAFGAHWVEGFVGANYSDPAVAAKRLANWRTAADYHLAHALAVLACGLLGMSAPRPGGARLDSPAARRAGFCLILGTLVFSGSLYALALTGEPRLGAVTPVGGVLLLLGWGLLAWAAFQGPGPISREGAGRD